MLSLIYVYVKAYHTFSGVTDKHDDKKLIDCFNKIHYNMYTYIFTNKIAILKHKPEGSHV